MAAGEGRRWGRRGSKARGPKQEPGPDRPPEQQPSPERALEQPPSPEPQALERRPEWRPEPRPAPRPERQPGQRPAPERQPAGQPPPGPARVEVEVFTGPESAFFATSSLVHGPTEALLVDTQLTLAAGRELAEWVASRARRLTAVVITHPHPDHYFGTEEILRLFPGTPVYAVPEVIEGILATGLAKVARWQPVFGDDLTSTPVVPGPLPGHRLLVDGAELDVLSLGQGDCTACSVVHVPAADTVVAGDLVYNGTHLWTAETTPGERADWLANLEIVRALGASRVVAGHRAPGMGDEAARVLGFTSDYLRDFDALLSRHRDDPAGLIRSMNGTYAELTLPVLLELSVEAATRPAE